MVGTARDFTVSARVIMIGNPGKGETNNPLFLTSVFDSRFGGRPKRHPRHPGKFRFCRRPLNMPACYIH